MIIDATKIWYFKDPPRSSYDGCITQAIDQVAIRMFKVKKTKKTISDKTKKPKKRK